MKIALATGNPHKAEELAAMWGGDVQITTAPEGFDPDETGSTYFQNALIKAEALRAVTPADTVVVADDSGLSVAALDGRPGVYSARYAGPDATFADNCALLVHELDGHDDRRAAFVCLLLALHPDGSMAVGHGVLSGHITAQAQGDGGFGYDPVFVPRGSDRSMAQMTPQEKNAISHRGRAARALAQVLGLPAVSA